MFCTGTGSKLINEIKVLFKIIANFLIPFRNVFIQKRNNLQPCMLQGKLVSNLQKDEFWENAEV